ncbi:MAG: FAD-dependent oxidoreductase [Actinobacteria bacterium]|nr:FAD-dependent oxidoreductase [Actinomycetota bacterium]
MSTHSDIAPVDVLIVGAGPAGTAAATLLARSGRSVVVVDKADFPRDKCCGDGLTTLALRMLEKIDFDPGVVASWQNVDSAWLRSPSGREVELPLPHGRGQYAAVAARLQLDNELVKHARAAGADVRERMEFSRIDLNFTAGSRTATVHFADGGALTARHVIAADGMWSPVRKAMGLGDSGYLGEWHAFRQYADNVTGPAAHRLYVWFEPDLLPGYAWSFPLADGRVNIGFGILRDGKRRVQDMKKEWADLLGDVAANYETTVRRHLFADHRMSIALGKLLRSSVVTRGAIRVAATNNWTRTNFARWMFEDEPRAVVFTPRRWHRRFLNRDGAY